MIAFKDQRPVGRIAAILNPAHNQYYQDRIGFFGFFDFVQNEKVAEALLKEAEAQLRSWGCDIARGPYSPSVNDECGLLVDGFDSAPMILMPFNPDYYEGIYSRLGLKKVRDLYAYYLTSDLVVPEKIKKVVERVKKRSGVIFRNINLKKLDAELKVIQELYNGTLKRNWGFVPMSFEELKFASEDLKQIIKPDLVMIAEKEGVPVGFSMLLPNMNEFGFLSPTLIGPLPPAKPGFLPPALRPGQPNPAPARPRRGASRTQPAVVRFSGPEKASPPQNVPP
ncbi:MAG: hypothetical protein ACKOA8_10200, partial [Deltaproteobacteria bacterium]